MSLSVNVALLGQQGVTNSNSTQQSTPVRLSGLTVNSPAAANEGHHGFGFGRGLLNAVFRAISQVHADQSSAGSQGNASPASGAGSSGAASGTSGPSATAAPGGASDGDSDQSGSIAAFDQALTQFVSALFGALSVVLQQAAGGQPTSTGGPVGPNGDGVAVDPASPISSGLTQLARSLPPPVSSASGGTSASATGSAASSAATTPSASPSPGSASPVATAPITTTPVAAASPTSSTPSGSVVSSTTSLSSGITAPSLQSALEKLQADFAALLQSLGVNTGASQGSGSGSGASSSGSTQAASSGTSSSVTAALQDFLQQLGQALSQSGHTYSRHDGHGHGHHHHGSRVAGTSNSSSTAANDAGNSTPTSAAGSGEQNIEIGIFIDITA